MASLYCVFRAGEDHFALPLLQVEEIISTPAIAEHYGIVVRIGAGRNAMKVAVAADDLISPGTGAVPENSMQFVPAPGVARFIQGRLSCHGVTAWALDPDYLINALLSPTRD